MISERMIAFLAVSLLSSIPCMLSVLLPLAGILGALDAADALDALFCCGFFSGRLLFSFELLIIGGTAYASTSARFCSSLPAIE